MYTDYETLLCARVWRPDLTRQKVCVPAKLLVNFSHTLCRARVEHWQLRQNLSTLKGSPWKGAILRKFGCFHLDCGGNLMLPIVLYCRLAKPYLIASKERKSSAFLWRVGTKSCVTAHCDPRVGQIWSSLQLWKEHLQLRSLLSGTTCTLHRSLRMMFALLPLSML